MSRSKEIVKYIVADFLSAAISWTLFYIYRKAIIEPAKYGYSVPVFDFNENYYYAIVLIPVFWLGLFWLVGTYKNIYKKSRFRELGQTISLSFLGNLLIFFVLLLDDEIYSYEAYRYTFLVLFLLHFFITYLLRFILLSNLKSKLKSRKIGFNTLLVGANQKALSLYNELENEKYSQGYKFIGFVTIEEQPQKELKDNLPHLGNYHNVRDIIKDHKIEEVILAVESSEHSKINKVISLLEDLSVSIKMIPDMYDIISGSVKLNYIFGTALIEIMPEIMPVWQRNLKRIMDITLSLLVLTIASPFFLALAIGVKLSSKGPVLYRQQRIGKGGEPFTIYKFRTMYVDAEKHGPRLSTQDDPRVTPFGRFLRKYRLDEFPQFWNVLIGDMSLVGPRPERQFFIDQIVQYAPHYRHLLKVKPGITSWGQIKFGYAENVDQMVERLKFDILYIENMSLAMDIKILFYTILIIFQGRGK